MTPERIEGPYRMESGAIWRGDTLVWQKDDPDDPREPCDLLNMAFAQGEKQALERVDRAAEELGEFGVSIHHNGEVGSALITRRKEDGTKVGINGLHDTFTQAILSTEGE